MAKGRDFCGLSKSEVISKGTGDFLSSVLQWHRLTLARREWAEVFGALGELPQTESGRVGLDELRTRVASSRAAADEMLTVAEPPWIWLLVVLGLGMIAPTRPSLLPIMERLRDQMTAQMKRAGGPPDVDGLSNVAGWSNAAPGRAEEAITPN